MIVDKMKLRALVSFLLICAIILSGPVPTKAEPEASTDTRIEGSVVPSIIKVSVPTEIAFSIDPNSNEFSSSSIEIVNNSNAPIVVGMKAGSGNFSLLGSSDWKPESSLPSERDWENLNSKDSEKYLALGIGVSGNEWRKVYRETVLYAKDQNNMSQDVVFGSIDGNSSAFMKMSCSHGLAFTEEKLCSYRITLSFKID